MGCGSWARTAGETKRMCVVCLEPYGDGDKVRILPCYHRRVGCRAGALCGRRVVGYGWVAAWLAGG